MVIELKNASKIIRGNKVIDDVSMMLESGTVYGLHGINGCGKTMLMRLVSGLIRPSSGSVLIDGNVLGSDLDFPKSMGLFIENPSFLGGYTGLDNLKLLASLNGDTSEEQLKTALRRVGLDPADKRKYRKYSLGMKQRLGIACAIMQAPSLLILDEPTNSLDNNGVSLVQQLITEEKKRGALVIITCHDKIVLTSVCDIIFTLEVGRITDVSITEEKVLST